jgi:hypothetical protein
MAAKNRKENAKRVSFIYSSLPNAYPYPYLLPHSHIGHIGFHIGFL